MKKLLLLFALMVLSLTIAACGNGEEDPDPDPDRTAPTISGAANATITVGESFDPMSGVTASDTVDGNLTSSITVSGEVDTDVADTYDLTYSVTNTADQTTTVTRTVTVQLPADLLTVNFKFADAALRHELFALAEGWLLTNMYGGIPLFSNSGFILYNERLQLPVDAFVPVMGWAATRSVFTQDDETAFGGEKDQYTYRSALGQDPDTLHQWLYTDATSSDVISLFLDSLYYFELNAAKDGYVVLPSMASADPQPIDSELLDTGIEVSKVWRIPLRTDLEWTFHSSTVTTGLSTDIKAADFVNTYKLAMEEGWFRATSGGGDFTSAPQEIVNAQKFVDGEVDFEDVGIKVIDQHTIEFTFVENISEWGVKYWLSGFVTTPIHLGLYDVVGDSYGTTPATTAYNGYFMLEYYEADRQLRFDPNPNFHSPDRFPSMTHFIYEIIPDAAIRFNEFLAGRLEAGAVDTARFEQFRNREDLRFIPGATTFRLMVNGTETLEGNRAAYHGNSETNYVPEPILAYDDFKLAMYYAIDRAGLAWDVLRTSTPQPYHFSAAYLVEAEAGVAFRFTDEADMVDDMVPGLYDDDGKPTYGYSPALAAAYWELAIDAAIADGYYEAGDKIEIGLNIFSGSEAQVLFGNFIKQAFETAFNDTYLGVEFEVTVTPRPFPGIYFDFMMIGEFDLSIGGISGSTLDASSFLDVYIDDNRGGFTLNWGVDTSTPAIEVTFPHPATSDPDDRSTWVTETWSFNALVRSLNGTVTIQDGYEYE